MLSNTSILTRKLQHMEQLVSEAVENKLLPNNMDQEEGFSE
jgi:hypothetical protein